MSGKKSTAAIVELRTAKVAELLIDGWSRARICEYARETARWGVSDAQIDRYISKARERIEADCAQSRKASYALAEARLEALYGKAVDAGDLRLALSIVKEQRALQGLDGALCESSESVETGMFYATLAAYADAIHANVPKRYIDALAKDVIPLAPVAESLAREPNPMRQCVEDMRSLGRTRTREELIAAGVVDEEDVELP